MTRDKQLEAIRAACIAANPDKQCPKIDLGDDCPSRQTRLADVLLAILKASTPGILTELHGDETLTIINENDWDDYGSWNLRTDDLTQQSDECIAFLTELLTNNTNK